MSLDNTLFPIAAAVTPPPSFDINAVPASVYTSPSSFFSRTPHTAGNRDLWTISLWFKVVDISGRRVLYFADGASDDYIDLSTNHTLRIQVGGTLRLETNRVFRDAGSWYHVVVSFDAANGTAANRLRLFINGVEESSFSTDTRSGIAVSQSVTNTAVRHTFGFGDGGNFADAYMGGIVLLDGTAVTDATNFGQVNNNSDWEPIVLTPGNFTFGTNGTMLNTTTPGRDLAGGVTNTGRRSTPGGGDTNFTSGVDQATNGFYSTVNRTATTGIVEFVPADPTDVITLLEVANVGPAGYSSASRIRTWTFDGFDGSTWTTLVSHNAVIGTGAEDSQRFSFSNSTAYQKYRINITANNGGSDTRFGNVWFWDESAGDDGPNPYYLRIGALSSTDRPSLNLATFNPDKKCGNTATLSDGNRQMSGSAAAASGTCYPATLWFTTGKYYMEVDVIDGGTPAIILGVIGTPWSNDPGGSVITYGYPGRIADGAVSIGYIAVNGDKIINDVRTSYGSGFNDNDVIGIAINADDDEIEFFNNGVGQGTISFTRNPKARLTFAAGYADTSGAWDFRARFSSTEWTQTPPAGFVELNNNNIAAPGISNPKEYTGNDLYTGDATDDRDVGNRLFSPEMIWLTRRNQALSHKMIDIVRGPSNVIYSDSANMQQTEAGLDSFTGTGIRIDNADNINDSGDTYVFRSFRRNTSFMHFQQFTGNGTAGRQVPHGLSSKPQVTFVKNLSDNNAEIAVYAEVITAEQYLYLSTQDGPRDSTVLWNDTEPDTTNMVLGSSNEVNGSGDSLWMWALTSQEGMCHVSKYLGNNNTDGPFIDCGFPPALVIIKSLRTDIQTSWLAWDNATHPFNQRIDPYNVSVAIQQTTGNPIDWYSNGIKLRVNGVTNPGLNSANDHLVIALSEQAMGNGLPPIVAR